MDFYNTYMGKRFYENTMPNLVKAIDTLTNRTEYAKFIDQPKDHADEEINKELTAGAHIVNITMIEDRMLVVFSKAK